MSYLGGDDLRDIFELQLKLQERYYGRCPWEFTDEERASYIQMNVLATTDELHEALAEVGWKPWASSRHLNRDAYLGELVDALHFFVNLCLAGRITARDLIDGYVKKNQRNHERQNEGYTGVKEKCPTCKRALDDVPQLDIVSLVSLDHEITNYCSATCHLIATEKPV